MVKERTPRNLGERDFVARRKETRRPSAALLERDSGGGLAGNRPTELEPKDSLPEVTLEQLPDTLRTACAREGWTSLMPVQAKTIPYILAKRDLMVQSRTGSGKTGAFLLPIMQRIDRENASCQALILVPTRELAKQVTKDAESLFGDEGIRIVAVYGGVGYGPQLDAFRKGAHLVIGTPGRVLDHLMRRSLSLHELKILIFDEADRMLSMGFYPDMKQVQRFLPKRRINGYMFSATYPPHVMRLAGEFLHEPGFLSLSSDSVYVAETEHVFYSVPENDKDRALVRILEMENPASAIIFCNTRAKVNYVNTVLQRFGFDADELSSDLSQGERERVMARVRAGTLRYLVATDVAARGIDIHDLSHVIQYEPPDDPEGYIHRAGRTGRAGASGVAISLVGGMEKLVLKRIAARFGFHLQERKLPSDDEVRALLTERLTALLEARLRARDILQTERLQWFVPIARSFADSEDGMQLLALLLDDSYQHLLRRPQTLPGREEEAGGEIPLEQPSSGERKPDSGGARREKRQPGRRGQRRR